MLKWLKGYFSFAVWERNAVVVLCILILGILLYPFAFEMFFRKPADNQALLDKKVSAFIESYTKQEMLAALADSIGDNDSFSDVFNPFYGEKLNARFTAKSQVQYFVFDPNKIGVEDWVKLGFSERQAESIEKLKAKGFKFYKPEDLAKVYVIGEDNYQRLAPYVQIDKSDFGAKKFNNKAEVKWPETPKPVFTIDINEADSSLWERQKGIGPRLAQRIVNYRNRLGGFVDIKQIREVWGLPDSTYLSLEGKMMVKPVPIQKVNINDADLKTMGKHPYINFTVARVIESYRKEHGRFASVEDLKKLPVLSDSLFTLMRPYITVE